MHILRHGMHLFRPRILRLDQESIHRGAPRPCGARPKAAPMLSLLNLIILCLEMCILRINIRILYLFGNISRNTSIIFIGPMFIIGRFATVCGIGKSQKLLKTYNLVAFGTSLEITKKLQKNYSPDAPGRPPAIQNYKKLLKNYSRGNFFIIFQ